MSNTEAPISFTIKVGPRGDLFTVRGDSVSDFVNNLRTVVNDESVADLVGEFMAMANTGGAVAAVKEIAGGTVTEIQAPAGPEEVTDKYGNKYTYGLVDAPTIPDTDLKAVLKEWTAKSGKQLKAYVHPRKGPKPSPEGGDLDFIAWV